MILDHRIRLLFDIRDLSLDLTYRSNQNGPYLWTQLTIGYYLKELLEKKIYTVVQGDCPVSSAARAGVHVGVELYE